MKAADLDRIPQFTPPADYRATWCVGGGKGGTKKSMTAFHAAIILSRTGKTVVYDTDPTSQSLTQWAAAYTRLTGNELPFHVIQYTAPQGLTVHADRTRREMNAKHIVFDIDRTGSQYRQALRLASTLILPINISTIETITLNAALAEAEEVANESDRIITAHVAWCGVDHHDRKELLEARATAAQPANNWPDLDSYVPYLKRYRTAFATCPQHTGAYENVAREIVTGQVATASA